MLPPLSPQMPLMAWWALVVILTGAASSWSLHLSVGSTLQRRCQRIFLACLMLVGLATMVGVALGPAYWSVAGTTLCFMVLAATCDAGRFGRGVA